MPPLDPTQRFSNRVADYVKYRPSYPPEAINALLAQGLDRNSIFADIGSGTGILTELLLEHVGRVYAIEPNDEMRAAAEARLGGHDRFVPVASTAEATSLPARSVDFVVAAQALHWFDTHPALDEFRRILREPRRLALIWNDRLNDTAFLQAYEALLQSHGTDYQAVNHQAISDQELANLFVRDFELQTFDNQQQLDLEGLKGRVFSSSYTPSPNDPATTPWSWQLKMPFGGTNKMGTSPSGTRRRSIRDASESGAPRSKEANGNAVPT